MNPSMALIGTTILGAAVRPAGQDRPAARLQTGSGRDARRRVAKGVQGFDAIGGRPRYVIDKDANPGGSVPQPGGRALWRRAPLGSAPAIRLWPMCWAATPGFGVETALGRMPNSWIAMCWQVTAGVRSWRRMLSQDQPRWTETMPPVR